MPDEAKVRAHAEARCIGQDQALFDEFMRRKVESFSQCKHPLAGTGSRAALIGRLVAKQMAKEREEANPEKESSHANCEIDG